MPAVVLHSAVVETIAQDIVDGILPVGEILRLDGIQSTFDISRTVAREVMRSLEAAGLVVARRRVGLVVQPQNAWSLLDPRVIGWRLKGPKREEQLDSLTQLRTAIEPMAAGAAARDAQDAQRERLVALAEELARLGAAGDLESFLDVDIAYHSLLLEASGNELFSRAAGRLRRDPEGTDPRRFDAPVPSRGGDLRAPGRGSSGEWGRCGCGVRRHGRHDGRAARRSVRGVTSSCHECAEHPSETI